MICHFIQDNSSVKMTVKRMLGFKYSNFNVKVHSYKTYILQSVQSQNIKLQCIKVNGSIMKGMFHQKL